MGSSRRGHCSNEVCKSLEHFPREVLEPIKGHEAATRLKRRDAMPVDNR